MERGRGSPPRPRVEPGPDRGRRGGRGHARHLRRARWARRGLATLLARTTETAAVIAGFRRFEALCTPASEAVRRRLGYRLVERVTAQLAEGITVAGAHMRKDLPAT